MPVSPIAGTTRNSLVGLSILLFAAALTQPAFYWGPDGSASGPGWLLLLRGWRGLSSGYVEWLANPLLMASWIAAVRGKLPLASGCAGLAAALMLVFAFRHVLAQNVHIASSGPGYWLWLASALLMTAACGSAGPPGGSASR